MGTGDDVSYPIPAGVQRYPAFGPLVHLALPPVDRPDGGEVVHAGVPWDPNREAAMMADNGPELVRHCLERVTVPPWESNPHYQLGESVALPDCHLLIL